VYERLLYEAYEPTWRGVAQARWTITAERHPIHPTQVLLQPHGYHSSSLILLERTLPTRFQADLSWLDIGFGNSDPLFYTIGNAATEAGDYRGAYGPLTAVRRAWNADSKRLAAPALPSEPTSAGGTFVMPTS
jgi:hypothetical protein